MWIISWKLATLRLEPISTRIRFDIDRHGDPFAAPGVVAVTRCDRHASRCTDCCRLTFWHRQLIEVQGNQATFPVSINGSLNGFYIQPCCLSWRKVSTWEPTFTQVFVSNAQSPSHDFGTYLNISLLNSDLPVYKPHIQQSVQCSSLQPGIHQHVQGFLKLLSVISISLVSNCYPLVSSSLPANHSSSNQSQWKSYDLGLSSIFPA